MKVEKQSEASNGFMGSAGRFGLSRRGFLQGVGSAGALVGLAAGARAADVPRDADGNIGLIQSQNKPDEVVSRKG